MIVPKPEKLSSGAYRVRLRLDGESISITRPTAREATREAEKIKADYRNGIRNVPTGGAVRLYDAIESFIAGRENVLSPSTLRGYRGIQRNHFRSYMSKHLDAIDWQAAVNIEARTNSPKSVKNYWWFITGVLKDNGLTPPHVRLPAAIPNETPWLTPEQIPVFMAAIRGTPGEIGALLALHGLRRSEIYGLQWGDIDGHVIHIHQSLIVGEDGKPILRQQNKTYSSTRNVPIMIPRLAELLAAAENQTGAVVTTHIGTLSKNVEAACKRAGLPNVTAHGLRHSFASLCYSLGLGELDTMRLGGWSDYQTMRKIYTHLSEGDKQKSVARITDYFRNAHDNAHGKPKTL